MFKSLFVASVVGLLAAGAMGQAGSGPPPNDECNPASPSGFGASPIVGFGSWNVDDLINATASNVPPLPPGSGRDIWFKWTATWQGTATLEAACAGFLWSEVYRGCACPGAASVPIASSSWQAVCITAPFDVSCGDCFIIRIVAEQYPLPLPNSQHAFTIRRNTVTAECPPPAPQNCDECCAKAPSYTDPSFASLADGRFAVQSHFNQSMYAMRLMDLDMPAMCPPGPSGSLPIFWAASSAAIFPPTPVSDWAVSNLGSVFALALDDSGNIFTGRFNGWIRLGGDPPGLQGTLAGSRNTSIIRLAPGGSFGTASVFVNLPDPNPPAPTGSVDASPGVGDIAFDCASRTLYASHLSDGRIYRVDALGAIQGWYRHATDTLSTPSNAATPECGAGCLPGSPCCLARYRNYAPLGSRVWALKARAGRLYYSTWAQDFSGSAGPNRVWSIGLTPSGDFVPGSRRAELTMPVPSSPPNVVISPPVSDIDFGADCRMVVAERGMNGPNTFVAHHGRLLEFAPTVSGTWTTTANYNAAQGFAVGAAIGSQGRRNSSGGCAVDRAAPGACPDTAGRYWVTSDAIILSNPTPPNHVYGIQGISLSNPALSNSIGIDFDSSTTNTDKGHQGDVEIPCSPGCAEIIDKQILCQTRIPVPPGTYPATGSFSYTFCFKNNSGRPIQYLFLRPPQGDFNPIPVFSGPNPIALPVAVPNGATSGPITVTINNQTPGSRFCFGITFADPNIDDCCRIEHCIDLPDCDCVQFPLFNVACGATPGTYSLTLVAQNLGNMNVNEFYAIAQPPGTAPFSIVLSTPVIIGSGGIPPGQSWPQMTFTISGATPGSTICIRFSMHLNGLECCSELKCIRLPLCDDGTGEPCPGCPDPTFLVHPTPAGVCAGNDATFVVVASVDPECGEVTCRWRKDEAILTDGPTGHGSVIFGATTQQLTIANAGPQDQGAYDNVVAATCGEATSLSAALTVIVIPGDADLDGEIDFGDITEILEHWGANGPADVDGDGNVDFQDITAVLTHFGEVCP